MHTQKIHTNILKGGRTDASLSSTLIWKAIFKLGRPNNSILLRKVVFSSF